MTPKSNLHIAWSKLLISTAVRSGIANVVLSPGSRSTPLVVALSDFLDRLNVQVAIDERAAGFFALGQARMTHRPSILICTSGSALAHYFPSIIESFHSGIPLIVLTADRPWEEQQIGTSQTMDQKKIFGSYVHFFGDLGLPDVNLQAMRGAVRMVAQGIDVSLSSNGPVHINVPFRKPLEPSERDFSEENWFVDWKNLMEEPPIQIIRERNSGFDHAEIEPILQQIRLAKRGIVICGPLQNSFTGELAEKLSRFSSLTGFPVLAESSSQFLFSSVETISHLPFLFGSKFIHDNMKPDLIVQIGKFPIAQSVEKALGVWNANRIFISPIWEDPTNAAQTFLKGSPTRILETLDVLLKDVQPMDENWKKNWMEFGKVSENCIQTELEESMFLGQPHVVRSLVNRIPEGGSLFIGNSSTIRDVDAYCFSSSKKINILHQRGMSGIDGLVAGAFGSTSVSNHPVFLLLGDVSFFHDLSSLQFVKQVCKPLMIIVIQNSGGRIFEHLPIATSQFDRKLFESWFLTDPEIDLYKIAEAFQLPFWVVSSLDSFEEAFQKGSKLNSPCMIEVCVSPESGKMLYDKIQSKMDYLFEHNRRGIDEKNDLE